jgi:hypothetical protein
MAQIVSLSVTLLVTILGSPVSTYHATIYSVPAEAFPQDQKHDIRGVSLYIRWGAYAAIAWLALRVQARHAQDG